MSVALSISKIILLVLCTVVPVLPVQATDRTSDSVFIVPVQSVGDLPFIMDLFQSEGHEGMTRIEFLYMLDITRWESFASEENPSSRVIRVTFRFLETDQLIEFTQERKIISGKVQNTGEPVFFLDKKTYEVIPGNYRIEMVMLDSLSGRSGRIAQEFVVRPFHASLVLSDLYFAAQIEKADTPSPFQKGGVLLIPNVRRVYATTHLKNAYVYYEISHLSPNDESAFYAVHYSVENLSGKTLISVNRTFLSKKASSASRIEKIPLDSLSSGLYRLTVHVTDPGTGKTVFQDRVFQVDAGVTDSGMILPMSEQDIEKYLKQMQYLITPTEKALFTDLNVKGKQAFLLDFWKRKDPDPNTPENEFMQEHFRRMAFAEKNIQGGIDSDMGRIYIQYGPPWDIQRQYSSLGEQKPVILWTYGIEGQVEFIFVDRTGDGKYALVHSTHTDEFSNPDWMDASR